MVGIGNSYHEYLTEFSDSEKPRVRATVILEPSYSPKAAENRKAAKKTQQRGRRRRSRMPGKLQHEQSLTMKVTNTKQAARDGSRSPGPRAATRRRRGAARLRLQWSNIHTGQEIILAAFVIIELWWSQTKSEKYHEKPTSASHQRSRASAPPHSRAEEDLRDEGATGVVLLQK